MNDYVLDLPKPAQYSGKTTTTTTTKGNEGGDFSQFKDYLKVKDHGMSYHSSPLNGDTGLKELESYIGATSLNLMDERGYDMENYTTELCVAEGLTSYYDNLLLLRSKILDTSEYFDFLSVYY